MPKLNIKNHKYFFKEIVLAVATFCSQYAYAMHTQGTPQSVELTTAYGLNVSAQKAFRQIVPMDYKLFIQKNTVLADNISWSISKPWTDELDRIAKENNVSVLLDWDKKTVFIGTEQTIQDRILAEVKIQQAASTPIPVYTQQAPVVMAVPATETTPTPPVSGIKSDVVVEPSTTTFKADIQNTTKATDSVTGQAIAAPSPTVVAAKVEATEKSKSVLSEVVDSKNEFSYTAPTAFKGKSLRETLQKMANSYTGIGVSFNTNLDYIQPGPVTLLHNSIEEDIELLNNSLGIYYPVHIELDSLTKDLFWVENPTKAYSFVNKYTIKYSELVATVSTEVSKQTSADTKSSADTNIVSTESTIDKHTDVVASDTKPVQKIKLSIKKGATLESGINQLVTANGFLMQWKVVGGFSANKDLNYEGDDLDGVLTTVLAKVGLVWKKENNVYIVRPGV